uniref:Uncharacterized protein n=1 Tax=Acrobeloides nanus TaxID=290746 RepID=A0A914DGY1_9BILA
MAAEKQRTNAFGGAPTSKFTLHDLEEYCKSKKEDRATGHDDTFVSAYRLNEDPLEVAMDGTFKLLWNGYVVQPFGYSDHNKNFTPTGLCLSDIENTIAYKTILET